MNFRKSLLHIYEKTNDAEKETPMIMFVKNQVGRILQRSFVDQNLKDFHLINANNSQKIQILRKLTANFNFLEFISYSKKGSVRFFEQIESGLQIIASDKIYAEKANSLILRINGISGESASGLYSKPDLDNLFREIHALGNDADARQSELRKLIKAELNPVEIKSNTLTIEDSSEFTDFMNVYLDSDLQNFSDKESRKLLFEMHPKYMEFKGSMIARLSAIKSLFNDGDYLKGSEELKKLLNEDWGSEYDLLNQMRNTISIVQKFSINESIPREAVDILSFNLNSFSQCYDDCLTAGIYRHAKSKLAYYASCNMSEFFGNLKEIMFVNACFANVGINDCKTKEIFLKIMEEKYGLSEKVLEFFKQEGFDINSDKIIAMGKKKIEKIMNQDETSENIKEVQERLQTYAKSTGDRLGTFGVWLFEMAKKAGKLSLLSLGALGIAILGLLIQSKRLLKKFFVGLSELLSAFALPILNIPIPKLLLEMLPPEFGFSDLGEGSPIFTIADLMRNILENGAFSKELRNGFNNKGHDIDGQQDLLKNKKDNLSGLNIHNYGKLTSNLLVGEIFTEFQGHKWKKEKIDFSQIHILESYNATTFNGVQNDYSFFLDRFGWSLDEVDEEAVIMSLNCDILRKGRNSVVCPRGYIPILTEQNKRNLEKAGISYKLYCVKEYGYFYIDISEKPDFNLDFELRRYGDEDCNGIFFGGDSEMANSRLIEKFLDKNELPDDMRLFFESLLHLEDDEFMVAFVEFSACNFKYSLSHETTLEHQKFKTHLSGVANTKTGDCKNVNSLLVGLARMREIKARMLAGYVDTPREGYQGHGITEVNSSGKCKLYDSTPSNSSGDSPEGESELEKAIEYIKDKIISISALIKSGTSKVNFSYVMEKLEEKLSILLAIKIIQKKKQLEMYIINKEGNGNFIPPISYDLMTLPDPTGLSKKIGIEQYKAFLKIYLNLLSSMEYEARNSPIWGIGNPEYIMKKKSRIEFLKKASDILGTEISYEDYMQAYFKFLNFPMKAILEQDFKLTDIDFKDKKKHFIDLLRNILEKNLSDPIVIEERLMRLEKMFDGFGLEKAYDALIDYKDFNGSDFIKSVYLPSLHGNEDDDREPFVPNGKQKKLLTSEQFSNKEKTNEIIRSNLKAIYSSIEGKFSRAFEYIDKDNFLGLLQESMEDMLKFPAFNDDVSQKVGGSLLPEGKYEGGGFFLSQENCSPMLRVDLLLQLYSALNGGETTFSILKNTQQMGEQATIDFDDFINREASKLSPINIYVVKFGNDDFINKVYLLMAKGIGISKFDNYLSQKRFLSDPENIIFVLRLIKADIAAIDYRFRIGTGKRPEWTLKFENEKNNDNVLNEKKKNLISLKNKLKYILNNCYADNASVIFNAFKIFGIENKFDKDLIMTRLSKHSSEKSAETTECENAINILLECHMKRFSGSDYGLNGFEYSGYGAELVSRFDLEDSFAFIPGEILIEMTKNHLEDEKQTDKEPKNSLDAQEYEIYYKNSKISALLRDALKSASYSSMLDSMRSKSLIYKLEERLDRQAKSAYSNHLR